MSDTTANGGKLHLPDLYIKGFGGIKELSISRLGRVTLFAGKNAVGKTTLLNAIQVYAARGEYSVLTNILRKREEIIDSEDEDGSKVLSPSWEALFYGRHITEETAVIVGSKENIHNQVTIRCVGSDHKGLEDEFPRYMLREGAQFVQVDFQNSKRHTPILYDVVGGVYTRGRNRAALQRHRRDRQSEITTELLGPELPSNEDMARFWDKVALTNKESRIVEALNLIFNGRVERVAMIGSEGGTRYGYARRAVVKKADESQPVPLKSLGDGATRLLGIALALANAQNGFLLIDEAENGIHHSIQRDFWTLVMKTAQTNNVQVLATTHSWDCIAGFGQSAADLPEVSSAHIRLDRDGDEVYAVEYLEEDLGVISEQRIETR